MSTRSLFPAEMDAPVRQTGAGTCLILILTTDATLLPRLQQRLAPLRRELRLYAVSTASSAWQLIHGARVHDDAMPALIVMDNGKASGANWSATIRDLSMVAPVLALLGEKHPAMQPAGSPERLIDDLLISGRLELVPRDPSLRFVADYVERLLRRREESTDAVHEDQPPEPDDFGQVIRHEMNNPLTGILGNAELLLARREQFSAAIVSRLETIAELAIRLRETVRLLSDAWNEQRAGSLRRNSASTASHQPNR